MRNFRETLHQNKNLSNTRKIKLKKKKKLKPPFTLTSNFQQQIIIENQYVFAVKKNLTHHLMHDFLLLKGCNSL